MATSGPSLRQVPQRQKHHLPTWMIVVLVALLGILIYGLMKPKTPSAFDRPEAQVNPPAMPWSQPRAY